MSGIKARIVLAASIFCLAFSFLPLLAQGTARQDYTGLDKYIEAGRPDDASFVGVRAAEFLTIPVGARGIAMGSAYSAVCDDISAIWWNPAGLGFLQNRELMLTVVDYTLDLTYSYGAFASPVGDGSLVIGGFFGYLNVPDIEITTVTSPGGTGNFYNAYDFQMGGSMAYNFSDRFIGGLNVKYIHQDMLNNMGGSAFGIDAGVVYHTEVADREIKFSFNIQNLGTNITMRGANLLEEIGPENKSGDVPTGYSDWSQDATQFSKRNVRLAYRQTHTYRLPTVLKIALAYNLYTGERANWLVAGEFWRPSYIPISYGAGSEVTFNFTPFLSGALRLGWQVQTDEYTEAVDQSGINYLGEDPTWRGFSFGGGIQRQIDNMHVRFSYAYKNKGRLSADNFFTLSFGF
ncbi:MAG: PorV/PorQ family protein [Candidatus Glassbacteria bacterium]|nr:PorV/PorQ family protein [Candidatus Glassbacteria bacterium]